MKMNQLIATATAVFATGVFAVPALAAGDMPGMDMSGMKMSSGGAAESHAALTDAEVKKVDAASGKITLKHGALENVGMPPMTMAFKAKDAAMLAEVHAGDKVKVRVENVNGTLTIVRLVKAS
ncbi:MULTISPECIES: copper-binding protein [unclassified Burkholderia]|uniref:copper-binding protein n=1 Tax=unclassified Burkholderia TaxID=2613784 RepID=UPI000F55F3AA|nr:MULTISPECIES: copper-binding protein [unclassified Burkholderia]RQR32540.1 RND transporter MFP subunit [Burkholderia sp. Bp9131]RQR70494.1 RND transporter MFP subunit [Burkholderia sp. Bp9015]RQR82209.1 RND transporter MFP subunit [Burkholderia sp. Bp9011]RQR92011.1 RND transporter MFP subunit [Burkholderia sp. Bp9010]RQS05955.1 RND transporter MFP subunit [Burkholderia sp. Bp8991]